MCRFLWMDSCLELCPNQRKFDPPEVEAFEHFESGLVKLANQSAEVVLKQQCHQLLKLPCCRGLLDLVMVQWSDNALLTKLRPDLRGGAVLNVLSGLFAEAAHVMLSLWRYSQNAMTWHQQDDSNSNDPLWSCMIHCMIILRSDFIQFRFQKETLREKWEMIRRVVQSMATNIQGGLLNPQGLGSWLFQAGHWEHWEFCGTFHRDLLYLLHF